MNVVHYTESGSYEVGMLGGNSEKTLCNHARTNGLYPTYATRSRDLVDCKRCKRMLTKLDAALKTQPAGEEYHPDGRKKGKGPLTIDDLKAKGINPEDANMI